MAMTAAPDSFPGNMTNELTARRPKPHVARVPLALANVNVEELENLHAFRATLADKLMTEGLSHRENTQLRYLDWQIDRLEAPAVAAGLAQMEILVEQFERASARVESFVAEVAKARHKRR